MTKEELKQLFSNGHLVTGADFTNLIDSLKALQTAVISPAAAGNSVVFVAEVTQDAEGKITVVRKNVNFSGYQTVAGMGEYQTLDLQQVGALNVDGTNTDIVTEVQHEKGHYPTVRVIDANGIEVRPTTENIEPYQVQHIDENSLEITLFGALNDGAEYTYILD